MKSLLGPIMTQWTQLQANANGQLFEIFSGLYSININCFYRFYLKSSFYEEMIS